MRELGSCNYSKITSTASVRSWPARWLAHTIVVAAAIVLPTGCVVSPAHDGTETGSNAANVLEVARLLAAREPRWRHVLERHMETDDAPATVGASLREPIELNTGGQRTSISLETASSSPREEIDGITVFADSVHGGTIVAPTAAGVEVFHLVPDSRATSRWRWQVAGGGNLHARGSLVEIQDVGGTSLAYFAVPGAIDARGVLVPTTVHVEGQSIVVALTQLERATFPVLVDPIIEVFNWRNATSSSVPSARSDHAMAYDSTRAVVVLFGGNTGSTRLRDTWEWNGTNWTLASTTGPAARSGHALAYDPTRGRTVLFGGTAGGATHYADTWEWDGVTWVSVTPAASPPARTDHALAFDHATNEVLMFGGWEWFASTPRYLADSWRWNGSRWQLLAPSSTPSARSGHAMASDAARGRVILFGGIGASGTSFGDTWEWDGANWGLRSSLGPGGRNGHAMAFNGVRGRVQLFGGVSSATPAGFNDTWEWDGASWASRSPLTRPGARYDHAMAYDAARDETTLFAGNRTIGGTNDTWLFTVRSLHTDGDPCALASDCVSGYCVDGVCCDTSCAGGSSDCRACSTAAGGPVNGTCSAVNAGAGMVCRPAAGPCDFAETCAGSTACPADAFLGSSTTCRPAVGACDVAETCSGAGATCPPDILMRRGTTCRAAANPCDQPEACDGVSAICPSDAFSVAGTRCRSAASTCDVEEYCDGLTDECPPNLLRPAGYECRPSSNPCDPAEYCDGTLLCPDQVLLPDGTPCGDAVVCNGTEACSVGVCWPGAAPVCDDSDPCTADACAEPMGCTHSPIAGCCSADTDCEDGNACTIDVCADGRCSHEADPRCSSDAGIDGGETDGGASPPVDAATSDGGTHPDAETQDGGSGPADAFTRNEGGLDGGGTPGTRNGSCGCHVPGFSNASSPSVLVALLALVGFSRRRPRRTIVRGTSGVRNGPSLRARHAACARPPMNRVHVTVSVAMLLCVACDPPRPTREEAQATLDGLDELHTAGEDLMWFSEASCDARSGQVRLSLGDRSANAYDLESLAFATELVAADLLEEITQEPYCAEGVENPPYSRCRRWGRMGRYTPSDAVRCSGYQVRIVVAELGPPSVRSLEFPDDATTVIVYERRTIVDEVVVDIVNRHRSRFEGRVPTATDGRTGRVRLVRSDDGWRVRDIL